MVISGQYFGWNYGFTVAGVSGMAIATGIVTLFYLCFMLSYAELAAMIPKADGPSAYAAAALGRSGGLAAGIACLIEFVFAPPAIAVAIGAYTHFLWPAVPAHVAAVLALAFCLLINLTGTKDVALFEMVITCLALFGLGMYCVAGFHSAPITHTSVSIHHAGFLAAIPFAIWLYLAIEGVVMTAEEVRQPERDLPRAIIAAIITIALCSILTLYLTATRNLSPTLPMDYPLSGTLAQHFGRTSLLVRCVDVLGLCGLLASLNGIIIGYGRQVFALSRAGYLPVFLQRQNRQGAPLWALLIPGIFGIICTLSADFANNLIILAAFGAIVGYCLSLVSLCVLRIRQPARHRPFKVYYPWVPLIALGLGLLCCISLLVDAVLPNTLPIFGWHCPLLVLLLGILGIMILAARQRRHKA